MNTMNTLITTLFILLLLSSSLFAAEPQPKAQKDTEAPKAADATSVTHRPVPIAMESEYNRADAALSKIMARPEIVTAQSDVNNAVRDIVNFCGDKATPVEENRHYFCVDKQVEKQIEKPSVK